MSNEFVMVPRELAQFIVDGGYCRPEKIEELRELLDKPAMHQGEPVAYIEADDLQRIADGALWGGTVWGRQAKEPFTPRVPVFTHADPGEVEQGYHHTVVEGLVNRNNELREERDTLRAQLVALRDLKLPHFLRLSDEMRAAGDHAEQRAREDQCYSVPVLKAVFFEAAIQRWLDDQEEALEPSAEPSAPAVHPVNMKTIMQAYEKVDHKALLHGTSNWCAAMATALRGVLCAELSAPVGDGIADDTAAVIARGPFRASSYDDLRGVIADLRMQLHRADDDADNLMSLLRECVENKEGLAYESNLLNRIAIALGASSPPDPAVPVERDELAHVASVEPSEEFMRAGKRKPVKDPVVKDGNELRVNGHVSIFEIEPYALLVTVGHASAEMTDEQIIETRTEPSEPLCTPETPCVWPDSCGHCSKEPSAPVEIDELG